MKVTSISYQKTFNLGNYSSERLGVEVEVGEHEYADDLMKEARELVEKMHRDGNPGLYYQVNPQFVNPEQTGTKERIIQSVQQPEVQNNVPNNVQPLTKEEKQAANIKNYIEVIKICKTEKNVLMYTKMVDKANNPELTEAYNNKLATLTAQPIKKETA